MPSCTAMCTCTDDRCSSRTTGKSCLTQLLAMQVTGLLLDKMVMQDGTSASAAFGGRPMHTKRLVAVPGSAALLVGHMGLPSVVHHLYLLLGTACRPLHLPAVLLHHRGLCWRLY